MLRNNYRSHNLIGPYNFWGMSPRNSTSFIRQFLGTRLERIHCTWLWTRGPSRRGSAYEISKSSGFRWISGFQFGFLDFWISKWISGFQSGFLDFKVDFWISKWISGFQVDFWISKWISGFQSGFLDFAISEDTAHEQS